MVLCDSGLRPPGRQGAVPLVKLAADSACGGILAGPGCDLAAIPRLAAEASRAGLGIAALLAPIPDAPLPAGKRLPQLAALDRDERSAAVTLARRSLEQAAALGASVVALDLGVVSLRVSRAEVERFFARRELGPEEPGAEAWRAAVAERKDRSRALVDAARFSMEGLLELALSGTITLAALVASSPWEVPSPREALEVLEDFRGAPLGLALDPSALEALGALGLAPSAPTRASLGRAAAIVLARDGVGVTRGFLPGQGEAEVAALVQATPPTVPVAVGGPIDAPSEEVAEAVRWLRRGRSSTADDSEAG